MMALQCNSIPNFPNILNKTISRQQFASFISKTRFISTRINPSSAVSNARKLSRNRVGLASHSTVSALISEEKVAEPSSSGSDAFKLTYLEGNSWLWEVGGVKLLVDPILVGNLDFGIPLLYDASKKYLKNFQNLVHHIDSIGDKPLLSQLTPKLRISWTSPLSSSSFCNLMGPKFFQIDNLRFELGIVLFFYAAMLRECGSQVLVTDLVRSTTIFRRAAGVYHYLAHEVLPSLKDARTPEGPPEATPSVALVMSFICLAEAQIVTTMKAEEKKTADTLLSKLHYGVVQLFDEATGFYTTASKECKDISPILMDYISCSKVVLELRSYKYMAQAVKTEGQIGIAIGLLKQALNNVEKKNMGGIESWRMVIKEDIDSLTALQKKM